MTKAFARALALAALLLAGQGAALHHVHESVADCLSGPCLEHESHTTRGETVSHDDACPICEMRGEQRAAAPGTTTGLLPLSDSAVAASARPRGAVPAPVLAGPPARAPPAGA